MPAPAPVISPLRSRIGRRILGLFIAVALVPVALLGGLAGQALTDASARIDRQVLDGGVRQAGRLVLDRLFHAKELLARWPVEAEQAGALAGVPDVFAEVAALGPDGAVRWQVRGTASPTVAGASAALAASTPVLEAGGAASAAGGAAAPWRAVDADLLQRWQRATPATAAAGAASGASASASSALPPSEAPTMTHLATVLLRALPSDPTQGRPAEILMAREVDGHLRWIAALDAERLWVPLRELSEDAAWTVEDSAGRGLVALGLDTLSMGATSGRELQTAQWGLFLRAELGAADWTLRQQRLAQDTRIFGLNWRVWLALAGAAILALVGLLSLVQIRRTLVPLGELTEGTRRLAGGDASVRIPSAAADEFGDLARAFNHMAGQIDDQMQSLHMLGAIDRDILRRAAPEEVGARVLGQFVASHAGAHALIAWVDEEESPSLQVLCAGPGQPEPVRLPPTTLDATLFAAFRGLNADIAMRRETVPDRLAPPWVDPLLQEGVRQLAIFCVPFAAALSAEAQRQGAAVAARRNRAVLCLGLPRERTHLLRPVLRQAEELRDRLAVAYAARERDDLLLYRAMHDSLTGLTNRQGLNEFTDALLLADPASPRALLFIDLDRFKTINDSLGHAAGDEVLCEVARRLLKLAPAGAVVARPGGDEFIMLLPHANEARAREMARRVCEQLALPFELRGAEHVLGGSVGIALAPQHGRAREDLMRRADMAMYAAKQGGRGRFEVFEPPMETAARSRLDLALELRHAIDHGELVPHYQPRVRVADGRMVSAEALVRWQHPSRGLVMPFHFIALAEESDLIEEIGLTVLDQSCAQLVRWRREGVPIERVSVNVSPRQLQSGRLLEQVRGVLDRHGLPPQALELEVTESLLVDDTQGVVYQLTELRRWGITIALDDFGTGYSSMATLRNLPIDVMKVDRAFVKDLGRDSGALAFTRAIITLAKTLGHHVVAEGVETEDQAALLRELGCDELQGYLYSRPVPADQLPLLPLLQASR